MDVSIEECAISESRPGDVTRILHRIEEGDERAVEELYPLVYDEIHRRAQYFMRGQRSDHTLQATALVNEAYLKMFNGAAPSWRDRPHFVRAASCAMRSVLVDHARKKNSLKRQKPEGFDMIFDDYNERAIDLLALDDALTKLEAEWPQKAMVVNLRFFGGRTMQEVAQTLDISLRTAERDFRYARSFLRDLLE